MSTQSFTLAMLSLLQGACAAQAVASSDPVAQARTRLQSMVREQELPGAQYIALTADRVLLDVQLGVADVATGQPMRAETQQLAYSLTKVVTAIAVLQLADAGRIELDAALSHYWPEHPYGEGVTIRSLLAHTAGVPNPLPLDWFVLAGEPVDSAASLRRIMAKHPKLDAAVGEAYGYSNIGYWLLERLIEVVSGQDYGSYVEQHVFAALGVASGAATFSAPDALNVATGHARRFSPISLVLYALTPSRYWVSSHKQWSRAARVQALGKGYGGLFCSAATLAAIAGDLLREQPRLLSPRARDEMWAAQRTKDGELVSGTLGWVTGELNGVRYFGKQGGGLGFHGNLRVYPQLGLATVLLANRTEIAAGPIDARSDAIDGAFVAISRR